MGQALYRKYRSKKLSEIVGQEHITTTLDNALKQGAISHAYLFTGPRGVGKTSIARILAHEVNGLLYTDESMHLDIIEIDAASNRRIDEIRDLREKVRTAPTSAKYKVYIIDEVHMLTREAFNALLKTLEEPPDHAIFILATTEGHKVPETIISRTQRFAFKPIRQDQAVERLRIIAKKENIIVNGEALALIAEYGNGSFRDSISLLDQVSAYSQQITLKDVQAILGIAPEELINKILELVNQGQTAELLQQTSELTQQGYQATQVASQLSTRLKQQLLQTDSVEKGRSSAKLMEKLLGVPASHNPAALLELILLETALEEGPLQPSPESLSSEIPPESDTQLAEYEGAASDTIYSSAPDPEPDEVVGIVKATPDETEAPKISTGSLDQASWQQILGAIKRKHNTLYGIVRMAQPRFEDGELILSFAFPFHQKRLNDEKNRGLISDIIKQQTGQVVVITCLVDKDAKEPPPLQSTVIHNPADEALENISNIFGDAEVLE